jgi:enoyl-CoA hydratase/carnithine racemase
LRLEHTPGLEIALACDLRVARSGPFQLGLPEVNLGVLPGTGGTQRLTRVVGKARALEMMVEGQTMGVERAHEIGLLNKVFEQDSHEAFMRRIMAYAHEFTPPTRAAQAVGRIKRAAQTAGEVGLEQGLALERELQAELFASSDAKEGMVAFTSKRKAVFRGR